MNRRGMELPWDSHADELFTRIDRRTAYSFYDRRTAYSFYDRHTCI
jgi:hypothetical protein